MKVHFIAIGGAVMHNLAIALYLRGDKVTGSDDAIFDPSRSRLERYGLLPPSEGWDPAKLHEGLDAVILGMHARQDNPELKKAHKLGIPVFSFPEFLYRQFAEKKRAVIAGSHGKTTITAMVLHVLHTLGKSPDYMVGARLEGFEVMVRISEGDGIAVLEGDEYLTSPLDPRPKFLHYKPHIVLISGIAQDHINVFPSEEVYIKQFRLLLEHVEKGGVVVYCADDDKVVDVVNDAPGHLVKIPYTAPKYRVKEGTTTLLDDGKRYPLKVFGRHNLQNIAGAQQICEALGITKDDFYSSITSFSGASRRLELIAKKGESLVFQDFAHAPSKLQATVSAVREQYPDHQINACIELHTFSSLNRDFLPQYSGTLDPADQALVFYHPDTVKLKRLPSFEKEQVKKAFGREDITVATGNGQLKDWLQGLSTSKSCLLIMSSGSFHGMDIKKEITKLGYELV